MHRVYVLINHEKQTVCLCVLVSVGDLILPQTNDCNYTQKCAERPLAV